MLVQTCESAPVGGTSINISGFLKWSPNAQTAPDAHLVETALTLADTAGVEFPDAYIAASASDAECDGVATFNRKDFARLKIKLADLGD